MADGTARAMAKRVKGWMIEMRGSAHMDNGTKGLANTSEGLANRSVRGVGTSAW